MQNPFMLTSGFLGIIAEGTKVAFKERNFAYGLFMLGFGYAILPAAFVVDLCIFAPLTIIFGIFAPDDDAKP